MITGEKVKESMKKNNINYVEHHNCSICGYMTNFFVENGKLFFDPGCDCVFVHPVRQPFQAAADWINMQSKKEIKTKIAAKFGLQV